MSSTVEDWLRSLGLIQYTQAFLDNGYDELDICKEMGEEDLDAIGVRNTRDRVDILSAVNRLKQSGTAVYFVLEDSTQQPTPNSNAQAREKILPLKLKMFLHDTLEEDNIKLSDYPYTLSNVQEQCHVVPKKKVLDKGVYNVLC
ncbi:Sterile alpha motif domain-containing protein 5 [Exaiptasia diaphana]|nr:Sterile alpha motif domain-containing protein 5 [Exaiptasia diaphana]